MNHFNLFYLIAFSLGKVQNSFSNAVLATHLLRSLCCLVAEEQIHDILCEAFLCSSVKRALQSNSNQLKCAATNFVMQATRFPKFVTAFKRSSLLEV